MDSRGFPVPILDGNQGGGGLLLVVQRVAENRQGDGRWRWREVSESA